MLSEDIFKEKLCRLIEVVEAFLKRRIPISALRRAVKEAKDNGKE